MLEGANERFDHLEGHFRGGEQIANYIEMDGSGVKGEKEGGESDTATIHNPPRCSDPSIASLVDDAESLPFQDGGGHVTTMESKR